MARTYGKAQDLIDFTRASGGTALRRVKYGAELVTNNGFDTSDITAWDSFDSTISVVSNELELTYVSATQYVWVSVPTEAGKIYQFNIGAKSSNAVGWKLLAYADGFPLGTAIADQGYVTNLSTSLESKTINVKATSETTLFMVATLLTSGTAYFDNVSVKEVTFDTSDGDLILFNHPANIPRIEYDASGNLLGLLVEESRTNLVPYSEAFDSIYYGKVRGDVASESIDDPFGQQGAFSWTATDFSESYIFDDVTITSGATITFSSFIKKKTADYCHLLVWDNSANGCRVWFDLVNGQVGTDTAFGSTFVVASSSITESANGWYRCSMTVTTSGSTTAVGRLHPSNGNGDINSSVGKSIYIYGAQLEEGSFPTSYIPTSGSTATRSADVASIATSGFGYNQAEGTVVVEANVSHDDYRAWFVSLESDLSNRFNLGTSPSNQYRAEGVDGGVAQWSISTIGAISTGTHKLASGIKQNDINFAINGVSVGTDTACTIPTVDNLLIAQNTNGNIWLNGHIKSIKYYPRRLTNDQLVELTS